MSSPTVVTAPRVEADPTAFAGRERDVLSLTAEERRWGRRRVRTRGGRELALALPTGTTLQPGDVLHLDATWYVAVEAAPEPVLAVAPGPARRRYASRSRSGTVTSHSPSKGSGSSCPTTRPWSSSSPDSACPGSDGRRASCPSESGTAMRTDSLLGLLQLCDGLCPVGGFAHSFGLETYAQAGLLADRRSLETLLAAHLEGSAGPADGAAAALAARHGARW